jgi:hypothetical protein
LYKREPLGLSYTLRNILIEEPALPEVIPVKVEQFPAPESSVKIESAAPEIVVKIEQRPMPEFHVKAAAKAPAVEHRIAAKSAVAAKHILSSLRLCIMLQYIHAAARVTAENICFR